MKFSTTTTIATTVVGAMLLLLTNHASAIAIPLDDHKADEVESINGNEDTKNDNYLTTTGIANPKGDMLDADELAQDLLLSFFYNNATDWDLDSLDLESYDATQWEDMEDDDMQEESSSVSSDNATEQSTTNTTTTTNNQEDSSSSLSRRSSSEPLQARRKKKYHYDGKANGLGKPGKAPLHELPECYQKCIVDNCCNMFKGGPRDVRELTTQEFCHTKWMWVGNWIFEHVSFCLKPECESSRPQCLEDSKQWMIRVCGGKMSRFKVRKHGHGKA